MNLFQYQRQRYLLTLCLAIVPLSVNPHSIALAKQNTTTGESQELMLDIKSKDTKRLEISSGFGGYRRTMVFYSFPEHRAVLKVTIDNKTKMFPVSAILYEFSENTGEKQIAKWLNNQHSDALFADAPRPKKTTKVAEQSCKTKSSKFIEHAKPRFGNYDNYKVSYQILQMGTIGSFQLKKLEDEAIVHLKVKK